MQYEELGQHPLLRSVILNPRFSHCEALTGQVIVLLRTPTFQSVGAQREFCPCRSACMGPAPSLSVPFCPVEATASDRVPETCYHHYLFQRLGEAT